MLCVGGGECRVARLAPVPQKFLGDVQNSICGTLVSNASVRKVCTSLTNLLSREPKLLLTDE